MNKKIAIAVFAAFSVLATFVLKSAYSKLTFLEFTDLNPTFSQTYQIISQNGDELRQEFFMPYDFFHGFSVQIGTFARDNNSEWLASVVETESGRTVFEKRFNASLIADNAYFMIDSNKNIRLKKGGRYEIHIRALSVNDSSSLAFYNTDGLFRMKIYGGDFDFWWLGFSALVLALVLLLLFSFYSNAQNGIKAKDDALFLSLAVSLCAFLMLAPFANSTWIFCDEMDNMQGGMIIANGRVLYRDYVTQHTPVAYYLCGVFALLGAGSASQFRLSFYLFEGLCYGLLFLRHSKTFGKRKLFALPIFEIIGAYIVLTANSVQILSDNIQGIAFVALLLEFLQYLKDRNLSLVRCVIVSVCVWASFGSAFVSAYALLFAFIGFFAAEVCYWKNERISAKNFASRYAVLFLAIALPLFFAVLYFKLNHSLRRAFDMFYTFNREVYSKYTGGFGTSIFQPFALAVSNFFNAFNSLTSLKNLKNASITELFQMSVLLFATFLCIFKIHKKRFLEGGIPLLVMIFSGTRGYGFHGAAVWFVAIFILCVIPENLPRLSEKIKIPARLAGIALFITLVRTYAVDVCNGITYRQQPVSELESNVVSLTQDGEKVYFDEWPVNNCYLFYKNRYPVNRAIFMLPWYMDWYEKECITDLQNTLPNVAVYWEDCDVWGQKFFSREFAEVLKSRYKRSEGSSVLWTRIPDSENRQN